MQTHMERLSGIRRVLKNCLDNKVKNGKVTWNPDTTLIGLSATSRDMPQRQREKPNQSRLGKGPKTPPLM